ncbi:Hypp5245 [Branchiostoma lanceolatum]|uniref:Centromere protein X n=1 Tax=Branchiostoma lanceolatum TaxID=7740 RepID=A0A8K0EYR9_BRALA|nr:Hypp5245 [Branchiostoma lanceolatum]
MAEDGATFKLSTVEKIVKQQFQDNGKTRMNTDAVKLTTELLRMFVMEMAARASDQARSEGAGVVEVEHLEKILPQLLLDF